MSRHRVRNVAASVRQRLLNRARERGEDFQLVLTRYAVERFLYRLSRSPYAGSNSRFGFGLDICKHFGYTWDK